MTAIRKQLQHPITVGDRVVRIGFFNEGQGVKDYPKCAPYNQNDPEDEPVLVLRAERKSETGWKIARYGAYVTQVSAYTSEKQLRELLESVWQRVHYAAYNDTLGNMLNEQALFLSTKWLEPWKHTAHELYPGASELPELEPSWVKPDYVYSD